jgi:hypothetical protein
MLYLRGNKLCSKEMEAEESLKPPRSASLDRGKNFLIWKFYLMKSLLVAYGDL